MLVGGLVGVALGVADGVALDVQVGVTLGVSLGVCVGVLVGVVVGVELGVTVGVSVGPRQVPLQKPGAVDSSLQALVMVGQLSAPPSPQFARSGQHLTMVPLKAPQAVAQRSQLPIWTGPQLS